MNVGGVQDLSGADFSTVSMPGDHFVMILGVDFLLNY